MAFIPCVRKTLDLSRALTALQPQRTAIVPCKCVQVCPCSTARLPQQRLPLTSPQLPLIQMDDFNKISFTPVEHKSHAWGWALPQAVSPGMAVGHNIYPRHPEPAAVIPTWVCPSSGAKARNGRGILSLSL